MKIVEPIEFISYENVKNNIEKYRKDFKQEGVLLFRNANLSREEQMKVQNLFGEYFDAFPKEDSKIHDYYEEDHKSSAYKSSTKWDEIRLGWHVEHQYFDNHMVMGFWNMEIFNTDTKNGNTLFVDLTKLFLNLSKEEQNFLKKCRIIHPDKTIGFSYYHKNKHKFSKKVTSRLIKEHWLTNEPIIRMGFTIKNELYKFNDEDPTQEQIEYFNDIIEKIWKQVKENQELWIVQQWQKGDLFVVDLEKMVHAVRGGFDSKDRKFTGMWSHRYDKDKYDPMDFDKLI